MTVIGEGWQITEEKGLLNDKKWIVSSRSLPGEQNLSLAFFSQMKHHVDEQNFGAFSDLCSLISATSGISNVNRI